LSVWQWLALVCWPLLMQWVLAQQLRLGFVVSAQGRF
jgi:hypothetical protein